MTDALFATTRDPARLATAPVRETKRSTRPGPVPATIPAPPVVSVVIPCFNESARIPALVEALHAWQPPFRHAEVIAVDDGSCDDTAILLEAAATELAGHLDLRVERLDRNRGKGGAVQHGVARAGGTYTVFLDADLSVGLDAIGPAIGRLDRSHASIAFGSRRHPESLLPVEQSWRCQVGGRVINAIARGLGLTTSHDTQCGFKVLRRDAAAHLFPLVREQRFAFDVELLFLADRMRYKTIEVPVEWTHRDGSTVSPVRDGLAMIRSMVAMRRRWRRL
jgi:glycosyltransferase involved in cell wall biosynthesis